ADSRSLLLRWWVAGVVTGYATNWAVIAKAPAMKPVTTSTPATTIAASAPARRMRLIRPAKAAVKVAAEAKAPARSLGGSSTRRTVQIASKTRLIPEITPEMNAALLTGMTFGTSHLEIPRRGGIKPRKDRPHWAQASALGWAVLQAGLFQTSPTPT